MAEGAAAHSAKGAAVGDLLVRLYDLPAADRYAGELAAAGATVRRALAYEKLPVTAWVRAEFGDAWAGECDVAFAREPVACYVATRGGRIVGFACHDSTCRNFFGPMGVAEAARGRGIGSALLLACLHAMAAAGYAYAIIGGAGDDAIYRAVAAAVVIDGSTPGIYRDRLARPVSPA
jgi:GNAT superfamily N-acetyltransferase